MPVPDAQAFVFTENGGPGVRARSLKELTGLLATPPPDALAGHLRRHNFSRWIGNVFRDQPLATPIRTVESPIESDGARDVADAISQAVRARYDRIATT